MKAINTNTKSRSISTGKPTDIRIYHKDTNTRALISYIKLHLEAGISDSETRLKLNGVDHIAYQETDTEMEIRTEEGAKVDTSDLDPRLLDTLEKTHTILHRETQANMDQYSKTYEKPEQQGSAGMKLELKHGDINTYSLLGADINIYKDVAKGTWTKLNSAIREILSEAQADQENDPCLSRGSQSAVDRVQFFVDEVNASTEECPSCKEAKADCECGAWDQEEYDTTENFNKVEAAWKEINAEYINDLEARRDEVLMNKKGEKIADKINALDAEYDLMIKRVAAGQTSASE